MPKPHPIVTDLRNAYEAHDRDALEQTLTRLGALLDRLPPLPCGRGAMCVCADETARRLCSFRLDSKGAP